MSTAITILNKLEAINVENTAFESIRGTEAQYKELLQDQLRHGKGSDGEDLTPGYLEDPYFKSREAARRYSDWKYKNSPSEGRNRNAPNLYIDGTYHNSISIAASVKGIDSDSNVYFGLDIEIKYRGKANILGGPYRNSYIEDTVKPAFIKKIKDSLK